MFFMPLKKALSLESFTLRDAEVALPKKIWVRIPLVCVFLRKLDPIYTLYICSSELKRCLSIVSFNTAAGEFVESVVHNNHLQTIPGCISIFKTMAVCYLMFELVNNSFNNIVSSGQSGISKVCPDELPF